MPFYTFRNEDTGEVQELQMKISELDDFKAANPNMKQLITGAPSIGDPHRMGVSKTPDSFNSLLKHIKKGNSKGITQSTINTR
mgnify:CR=1 FL=1